MSGRKEAFDNNAASKEPQHLETWDIGETITRENAASFLWQTFFMSKGSEAHQALIFLILINNGFLESFATPVVIANHLTSQEVDIMLSEYERINSHPTHTSKVFLDKVLAILQRIKEDSDKDNFNARRAAAFHARCERNRGIEAVADAREKSLSDLTAAVTKQR